MRRLIFIVMAFVCLSTIGFALAPRIKGPHYILRIGSTPHGTFTRIVGLPRKGSISRGRIALSQGHISPRFARDIRAALKGQGAKITIEITQVNEEGSTVGRWEMKEAWPTKYDSPDLNAKGNEVAIETLEIEHEGVARVSGKESDDE